MIDSCEFPTTLGAIKARVILMPCAQNLCFPPENNAIGPGQMPTATLRPHA